MQISPSLLFTLSLFQIQRNTTPMYRSPEMIDLYSNQPVTVKADIWVRKFSNAIVSSRDGTPFFLTKGTPFLFRVPLVLSK